jgi:putative protein-disulfide isomerase
MTPAVEQLRRELGDTADFDFFLAGINTATTQPIGDYGRRRIRLLWQEVHAVTGQRFGDGLPDDEFIYNSSRACVAVHAMRELLGAPPFEFLHALQMRFFQQGEDVGQADVLIAAATDFGVPSRAMVDALEDPELHAATKREFESACRYGTQALPNVLVDVGEGLRLLAGGYADAPTLRTQIAAVASGVTR